MKSKIIFFAVVSAVFILGLCDFSYADTADVSNWADFNTALSSNAVTEINVSSDIAAEASFPAQSRALIVNGNGFTLDGSNAFEGFVINSGDFTLGNVTVSSFTSATYGGAIKSNLTSGIYTIYIGDNSNFINNRTDGSGGGQGGAIFTYGALVLGDNVSFIGNSASGIYGYGGAVDCAGLTIGKNAVFSGNQALGGVLNGGGAISAYLSLTIDDNATFTNNRALGAGGAIEFSNGTITINTSGGTTLFDGNTDGSGPNDIALEAFTSGGATYSAVLNITGDSGKVIFNGGISSSEEDYDAGDVLVANTDVHIIKSGGNELIFGENAQNINYTGDFIQTAGVTTYYGQILAGAHTIADSDLNLRMHDSAVNFVALNISNANINSINGTINSFTVENFSVNGTNNFSIDIDGASGKSDRFVILNPSGTGTVNVDKFNVITAPTSLTLELPVFTGDLTGISFTSSENEVTTPIYVYKVISDGNGVYTLVRSVLSKGTFRGMVSSLSSYFNQFTVNNNLFDHIYFDSGFLHKEDNKSFYYRFEEDKTNVWFKAYGSFDTMQMTQDLSVRNNAYGGIAGIDFIPSEIGAGWDFLSTAYLSYNGGNQKFSDISMAQNGGQGGLMGTFKKNKFTATGMAYAGGYSNTMSVEGFDDENGNWFAGAAARGVYNLYSFSNFLLQPMATAAYNVFGRQSWKSDYGSVDMSVDGLNGWNVSPGLNIIYGRETATAYVTAQYVYNVTDGLSGSADSVNLPGVKATDDGFFQCGIGVSKAFGENLNCYCQANGRSGAVNGAGFQLGATLKF